MLSDCIILMLLLRMTAKKASLWKTRNMEKNLKMMSKTAWRGDLGGDNHPPPAPTPAARRTVCPWPAAPPLARPPLVAHFPGGGRTSGHVAAFFGSSVPGGPRAPGGGDGEGTGLGKSLYLLAGGVIHPLFPPPRRVSGENLDSVGRTMTAPVTSLLPLRRRFGSSADS